MENRPPNAENAAATPKPDTDENVSLKNSRRDFISICPLPMLVATQCQSDRISVSVDEFFSRHRYGILMFLAGRLDEWAVLGKLPGERLGASLNCATVDRSMVVDQIYCFRMPETGFSVFS